MDKSHLDIVLKAAYYGIVIITVVFVILPIMGVEPSSLLVAGSILGLVIGFASQSIVGNLISGLFLIFERPIKLGNQVNIDGNVGIVEDISLISTIIRTFDGLYVRIPNEKVFTTTITNYVANVARRFEYVVGIRYSDDADQAIAIIKGLIEESPMALKNPAPGVFVDNLGDNSVNISVKIWAPATDWYAIKTELLWKIKKTLEENGIEIAFPQRVIWIGNEQKDQQLADPDNPTL
ncbi:mechanosensitive ion channel family protein [Methanococcoides sp. FTZ1]|uniref:mechanosensitive ion channel family protein n=1 Tax=Methanococcoides sp. FTZ1 TaxID=3439061 RepID=UPI003F83614D